MNRPFRSAAEQGRRRNPPDPDAVWHHSDSPFFLPLLKTRLISSTVAAFSASMVFLRLTLTLSLTVGKNHSSWRFPRAILKSRGSICPYMKVFTALHLLKEKMPTQGKYKEVSWGKEGTVELQRMMLCVKKKRGAWPAVFWGLKFYVC